MRDALLMKRLSCVLAILALALLIACQDMPSESGGNGGGNGNNSGNPVEPFSNISNADGADIQPTMVSGRAGDPWLAEVFLAWTKTMPGHSDIYFTRTVDNGTGWRSAKENISNTVGSSFHPAIALYSSGNQGEDDYVLVTWDDNSVGDHEIFLARSSDGGSNFDDPINVSQTTGLSVDPAVAITHYDSIIVAWQEELPGAGNGFEIFAARSVDGGRSFGDTINVSKSVGVESFSPVIANARNSDLIIVVWTERTPDIVDRTDIFMAISEDKGMSFKDPVQISSSGVAHDPAVAFSGSKVLLAWWENDGEIYVTTSDDKGNSFDDPVNISLDTGLSLLPAVAYSFSNQYDFFVAWEDTSSNEIFLTRSQRIGSTFEMPVNLSGNDASAGGSLGSFPPAITILGDDIDRMVFVAWSDNSIETNAEIVVATRPVDGAL